MSNYLYNGVELPALPEWDRETYPYAYIHWVSDENRFYLCLSEAEAYWFANTDGRTGYTLITNNEVSFRHNADTEEWERAYCGWQIDLERALSDGLSTPLYWTNVDIYSPSGDGTLYLAASDPIPVTPSNPFCLRSWLTGFALGLAGKSLPYSKPRKPVAYLYNGVKLPALPEWDKETYPYAVIILWGEHVNRPEYRAFVTTTETNIKYVTTLNGSLRQDLKFEAQYSNAHLGYNEPDVWGYIGRNGWTHYDSGGYVRMGLNEEQHGRIIWSNHDILNEDGTIYFAKCADPTPIYE